jgi:hypothetical protein
VLNSIKQCTFVCIRYIETVSLRVSKYVCVFNYTLIIRAIKSFTSSLFKVCTFETVKKEKSAYAPELLRCPRVYVVGYT